MMGFAKNKRFTPKVCKNLVAWYDALDVDGIKKHGENVSIWSDKSLNNFDMVQGDGRKQPYHENNAVHFKGNRSFDLLKYDVGHVYMAVSGKDGKRKVVQSKTALFHKWGEPLHEVIVTDGTESAEDARRITTYLRKRWGIT